MGGRITRSSTTLFSYDNKFIPATIVGYELNLYCKKIKIKKYIA